MQRISAEKHQQLVSLRKLGKSIPEISRESGTPITTVQRHIKDVVVPQEYVASLREKQGGSKERAKALRENIAQEARRLLGTLSGRDRLILLIGLYWGEGTKKDFELINSDPFLIQTFIRCITDTMHVPKSRLSMIIRIHDNIPEAAAIRYWSEITGLSVNSTRKIEVIVGKKKGRLKYGMCRIRVKSGVRDRLLIQSLIALIGRDSANKVLSPASSRSSMDRTAAS